MCTRRSPRCTRLDFCVQCAVLVTLSSCLFLARPWTMCTRRSPRCTRLDFYVPCVVMLLLLCGGGCLLGLWLEPGGALHNGHKEVATLHQVGFLCSMHRFGYSVVLSVLGEALDYGYKEVASLLGPGAHPHTRARTCAPAPRSCCRSTRRAPPSAWTLTWPACQQIT